MMKITLTPLRSEDYRVSVVLPVFSETESVRIIVRWLKERLADKLHEVVVIVSPRSQPETHEICQALAIEDPRVRVFLQKVNPGLGNAVREGFARATGNLILCMDSDGEMEIETVPRMLETMASGDYGMVVASRWAKGGGFSGYDPYKFILNWGFQRLFRLLFRTAIGDLTYGFKLIRAEVVRSITWEGVLHEIACETTMKPIRMGVRVAEVPSKWCARTAGVTKNAFLRNFRYVHMALKTLFGWEDRGRAMKLLSAGMKQGRLVASTEEE